MSDEESKEAVAVLIPLRSPAKKAVRVNITLAEDLLRAIDFHAETHGLRAPASWRRQPNAR